MTGLPARWLVGVVAAMVAAAAPAIAQPGRLVMGQVRDTSGRPIADANVVLMPSGLQTSTSERGHFAVRGAGPGPGPDPARRALA